MASASASAAEIIEAINSILESGWSKKQLARGKWFEIKRNWSPEVLKSITSKYREAGWHVTRTAELTHENTRIFLVIGHPGHVIKTS